MISNNKKVHMTIIDKFYKIVGDSPQKSAISMKDKSLTYNDLNVLSNNIAHHLIAQGIQKRDFVGVFLNRSIEGIISLLGIMKTGAVYVPIDPAYPDERIQYMMDDTSCKLVITNSHYQEKLKNIGFDKKIYTVDHIEANAQNIQCSQLDESDLAYVIYTSGSTGNPKGTLIKHKGVLNLAEWLGEHYRFNDATVISEFASFSFDASIIDIFQALLNGVRLHILSEDSRKDPIRLIDEISDEQITNMILPTAYFRNMTILLKEEDLPKLSSLKVIALAGEALTGEMVRLWQQKFGYSIKISNFYGPTETTVMASFYDIEGKWPEDMANVPIGKPIQDFHLYIVNESGEMCKTNESGELLIEGPGLSVGYLHKPEKTAQAFIDHPTKKDTKLYKTGDIVRLLDNGNIEFVGRNDHQVKIRGHRVEIGEIEDKMLKIPFLKEVAVIPKQVKNQEKELFAFYTSKTNTTIDKSTIFQELKNTLPDYIIPSYFIQLEEMPIAPTGKIDRKLLAILDYDQLQSANIIEPRNETERILAQAICDELEIKKIDTTEDLFTNGLNSLKVLNVLVKLKPNYPNISIQDFYQYRSIEKIAQFILTDTAIHDGHANDEGMLVKSNLIEHPIYTEPLVNYSQQMKAKINTILLTGATGFLGSHILYDLLKNTTGPIFCLTRAKSIEEAKTRLEETLNYYFDDYPKSWLSRIYPIIGDLSKNALGLGAKTRKELIVHLDMVIHCAADVRHFGDESHFNHTNVNGTGALLNLIEENKSIRFIYISTIGIPDDLAHSNLWEEYINTKPTNFSHALENVYTSSKFEAEKLVYDAMEKGALATVCRMGNLTGHSVTGKFQKNINANAFYRMLKAAMTLEKMPKFTSLIDLTPVDLASRSIVEIAMNHETIRRTFHIVDPKPISFVQFMNHLKELGYEIDLVDKKSFSDLFLPEKGLSKEDLQLAVSILEGEGVKDSLLRWDCTQTQNYTSGISFDKKNYLSLLVQHGENVGYFPILKRKEFAF